MNLLFRNPAQNRRRNHVARNRNHSLWKTGGGWLVLLAFCSTGFCQTTETPFAIAEARVNLPIPDNNPVGATHTISIAGADLLEFLEVAVQIDHPAPDQLVITLKSPAGISAILHNRTFSDEQPFSPVYESKTTSVESLSKFLNSNPKGHWTLTVTDLVEGQTGVLTAWGLKVQPPSLIQPMPPTPVPLPPNPFALAASLTTDGTFTRLVAADANRDGIDDLFLLSEDQDRISLYFSNGSELFAPPLSFDIQRPQVIAPADLNADGWLDFIVGSQNPEVTLTTITVFMGNSAGGFSKEFTTQVGTAMGKMIVIDATHDGILDIITGGIPQLIEGVGDGSFKPATQLIHLGHSLLTHGDLNEDGFEDLLVTISRGGTSPHADPFLLFGALGTTFPTQEKVALSENLIDSFSTYMPFPDRLQFATVNMLDENPSQLEFNFVYMDDSDHVALQSIRSASGTFNVPFTPFDLNGDGLDEFLFLSATGLQALQLSEEPTGGQTTGIFSTDSPRAFSVGHFFADGSLGIAILETTQDITLLRSTQGPLPTPTPTVLIPTSTPFLFPTTVPSTPTPTPVISTPTPVLSTEINPDINGDGIVNRQDLLLLLKHWGQTLKP